MIGFAYPWALLGLIAAALPILLHLVQKREPNEIAFPAVRYLDDTTKEHRRRLKLRHWLLLGVRTLLILVLVLAAAGMTLRRMRVGGHPASALILVIDNSASSSAMVDGTPILTRLKTAGTQVLSKANAADRVWLLTADGRPRAGDAKDLQSQIAELAALPIRLDLGAAITQGRSLIKAAGLPGEVVLLTDMQRSALSAASGDGDILVGQTETAAISNRGLLRLEPESQPWGTNGGDVKLAIFSSDTVPVPVTLSLGGARGAHREMLLTPGFPISVHLDAHNIGWNVLTASIPPDELRLDDAQQVAIRVAPPAAVMWSPADRFLNAALDVLVADRRMARGNSIQVGTLGSGASLVVPPEDPAQIGGLNRALAARGIPWQFGTVIGTSSTTDSTALMPLQSNVGRRVMLRSTGTGGEILATVHGEPWLVRGGNVLILGSRLDPAWTDLPISAGFVPLLDALLSRALQGSATAPSMNAGDRFTLPSEVNHIVHEGSVTVAEGGAPWRIPDVGIYYLLAGSDTVGSIASHVDSRESILQGASPSEVQALWPGAIVAPLNEAAGLAFGTGRGDLRKILLAIALICVIAETILARHGARLIR